MGIFVVLGIAAFVVVFGIGLYNRLVTARNGFKNAFAQIDVQLTRRYELIPNLVATAKAYLKHERETLEAVIAARNTASDRLKKASADPGNAGALSALAGAESQLGGALGRLMLTVEAYPELKAGASMMQLSEELTSTENRVAFARQAFNDAVLFYNNARETFPGSLVAGFFSFKAAQPLDLPDAAMRQAPRVSFG